MPSERQYLKLDMRRQLDDMVKAVNSVLARAARDSGPNVRFIDYDEHIKRGRGRYCEAGVHEPDPNRLGLSFYEWNTVDTEDNVTELYNTGDDVRKGSFEGDIAVLVNKTLREHPDWEFDPEKGFVNKSKIGAEDVVGDIIWWLLPVCISILSEGAMKVPQTDSLAGFMETRVPPTTRSTCHHCAAHC